MLKKFWSMKMRLIRIVVDALGTVSKKNWEMIGKTRDLRMNCSHTGHSTVKIRWNT